MSTPNNLKVAGISLSLLALVSCGSNDSSSTSPEKKQREQTREEQQLSAINWKIYLQGRSFPMKSRVEINDQLLIDECLMKQEHRIDRSTDPQSISLEDYLVPTGGELKIAITDLGASCGPDDDTVFFAQDNVPFDIVKTSDSSEIIVNL